MSLAEFGSFSGVATPNINMLDVFRENERRINPYSILNFGRMSLSKLSMSCPAGTKLLINGKEYTMKTNVAPEFGLNVYNVTSLIFEEAVQIDVIYYF